MNAPTQHANGRPVQVITLTSPVGDRIAGYVLANSLCQGCHGLPLPREDAGPTALPVCQCPEPGTLPVVGQTGAGRDLILCGSGPSLPLVKNLLAVHPEADVWGCNDALMWLTARGLRVTHGVGIDQSPDLYTSCWTAPPAVTYLLATSVDHRLVGHLIQHGHRERIAFFHSFCGFAGEEELYRLLYPPVPMVGSGLNVVNRSVPLADWMGYRTIYVVGADCALGKGDAFHVGETAAETGIILRGTIGGRKWATKPDMLLSACDLVRQKRELGDRLQFIGRTLPAALEGKDDAYLDRCIRWHDATRISPDGEVTRLSDLQAAQAVNLAPAPGAP